MLSFWRFMADSAIWQQYGRISAINYLDRHCSNAQARHTCSRSERCGLRVQQAAAGQGLQAFHKYSNSKSSRVALHQYWSRVQ
jgi:hypothetical protein